MIRPRGEGLLKHLRQAIPWEASREQVPEPMVTECVTTLSQLLPQRCRGVRCGLTSGRAQTLPGASPPPPGPVQGSPGPTTVLWVSAAPRGPRCPSAFPWRTVRAGAQEERRAGSARWAETIKNAELPAQRSPQLLRSHLLHS